MTDTAIGRVRTSCKALLSALTEGSSPDVRVESSGVERFAHALLSMSEDEVNQGLELPLQFENLDAELNIWFLIALLAFGSGFRHELHTAVEAGAADTMLRGVIGLHLSGKELSARFLSSFKKSMVTEYFGFATDSEVQIMPAVYETKPNALAPLAVLIADAVSGTGRALVAGGHRDIASWLRSQAANKAYHNDVTGRPCASKFVALLADSLPAFRDIHTVAVPIGPSPVQSSQLASAPASSSPETGRPSLEVAILKKAQLAAKELHRKFKARLPSLFDFDDVGDLTIFADNVIPAVLRREGVLQLSPPLAAAIDSRQQIPTGLQDTALRAGAIVACEAITVRVRELAAEQISAIGSAAVTDASSASEMQRLQQLSALTEAQVDEYLWRLGKKPEYRKLERHATKDTMFY